MRRTRGTTPQVPVMRSLYAGAVYMVSDHQRELWVCCLFMSSSPDKTTPEGGRQEFKLPQKGNKDPHSSLLPWRRIILAKSRLRGLSWELEPGLLFHVSCYCPFSERESTNISPSAALPRVLVTQMEFTFVIRTISKYKSSNVPHLTRYDKKRQMLPLHTHAQKAVFTLLLLWRGWSACWLLLLLAGNEAGLRPEYEAIVRIWGQTLHQVWDLPVSAHQYHQILE